MTWILNIPDNLKNKLWEQATKKGYYTSHEKTRYVRTILEEAVK